MPTWMLLVAVAFIFSVLLEIAFELRTMTERLIEIGTIVEYFNRRDLRDKGIIKDSDDDQGETITKAHRSQKEMLTEIVLTALGVLVGLVLAKILPPHR